MNDIINTIGLDKDEILQSLKDYLKTKDQFKGFNF